MKNIFNWKRFTMVVQKDVRDLRSQYLKLILIVACTFLVIFLLSAFFGKGTFSEYGKIRFGISIMFLCIGTLLAPFQLYKRFNQKIHGVNYFMLPASQAEKWTSMFLHCVIITPVVIILSITFIDLCLYPFYSGFEKSLWFYFFNLDINSNEEKLVGTFMTFFALQSLLFLGNIWFQRAKMQKTIVTTIILLIAHVIFTLILVKLFGTTGSQMSLTIKDMSYYSKIWGIISMTIICMVAPIGLWIVSFMKMKEQQL